MVEKVVYRYARRILLPYPVRAVYTTAMSLKYIYKGVKTLLKGKIEVPVLDATAIGVSVIRNDIATADSIMFLLGIGELLEEWTHKKSVDDLARTMSLNTGSVWMLSEGKEVQVSSNDIKEGDCVVGMSVVREGGLVLTVSETGYGRLSSPDDYRVQSRGGKGLTNYHTEKYGDVAAIKVVNLDDDIIIISEEGIIIRIAAESIRVCARPSKGVTVMKVNGDDRVVTIARVPHIDGEDDESAESEDNAENGEPSEAATEEVSENNEGETSDSTEENTEE